MYVPAEDEDLAHLSALMNHAYRGIGAAAGWSNETAYITGDRTTPEQLRAEMRAAPTGSLLKWVERPGTVAIGCVWLQPIDGMTWYLGSLTIDPERQAAGLGTRLLSAAEHWIWDRGGRTVRITVVNVREPLIAWYVRRGYRVTGETEPFPRDDRFGVPLRDDLAFTVLAKTLGGGRDAAT